MHRIAPAAMGIWLATTAGAQAEATALVQPAIVKPLVSADVNSAGQPFVFPQQNVHVTAAVYEVAPGAVLPEHKHPFPRLAYVLGGTLRVTYTERSASTVYKTGDFVLEAVDIWHKGENIGPDTLRLLVIDLSEKGAATTIMKR